MFDFGASKFPSREVCGQVRQFLSFLAFVWQFIVSFIRGNHLKARHEVAQID